MKLVLHSMLALACASLITGHVYGQSKHLDLSRLVVVGDSLSAGVQNFSLLDTQQPNGYASLLAAQAGVNLTLPLVPYPGAPNVLELVNFGPPPVIAPAPGTLPNPPRDNPAVQATNLSVPGITIADALLAPDQIPVQQGPVAAWAQIVLGYPGPAQSQVSEATALNPTTILFALGNNDALVPAITGQVSQLTPIGQFASSYATVISDLAATKANLVVVNIPDVMEVPYFTTGAQFAAEAGVPFAAVHQALGINPDDYLLSSAIPIALGLLQGTPPPPPYSWPTNCPVPAPGLLPPGVPLPCYLTAAQAGQIRLTIAEYNAVIALDAFFKGATLVDLNGYVHELATYGYKSGSYCLNAGFLGGLFSLDGIHPTNTGYALIANLVIDRMNQRYGANIPEVNVANVIATDPLVFPTDICPAN